MAIQSSHTERSWATNGVGTFESCFFYGINFGNRKFYYGSGYSNVDTGVNAYSNVKYEYDLDFPNNRYIVTDKESGTAVLNKTSLSKTPPDQPFTFWIYGFNGDKGLHSSSVYEFKAYISGSMVLDLIPVRIGQVGKFYDQISGQFFENKGTGSFILGPDV